VLVEVRRYASRPDAEIVAWALRSSGVAAELRRVKERASTDGLSVVVIPEQGIAEARRVLAAERFQVEAHESEGLEWSPIPAETVVAGLREISRRQKRARFWLLMLLPAGLLGVASGSQFLFSLIPIVWMPGFLIAYFRALNADCPRCGLPFGRGRTQGVFVPWAVFSPTRVKRAAFHFHQTMAALANSGLQRTWPSFSASIVT